MPARVLAYAWRGGAFVPQAVECREEAMRSGQLPLKLTFSPWLREALVHPQVLNFLGRVGEAPGPLAALRLEFRVT